MKLTARGLNRATLGRQLLLRREPLGLADGLRRVVALQAQQPASPYLALWNRLDGFDPTALDAAFADGTVVKANVPRMTLHGVLAEEYRVFREAMEPTLRLSRLGDDRFTASGLSRADADALVPDLVAFARQVRTAAECEAWLEDRVGTQAKAAAWWGLRQYAPLLRAPTREPWSFGNKVSYVAPRTTPVLADEDLADKALQTLMRRFLEGFGPATAADAAQFAMVYRSRTKKAVRALGADLERLEGPNGEELLDVPGAAYPDADTPAPPRLLGMWDNVLLSHVDRSRVIPPEYRKLVIRNNGDALPTLFVDGYVAGVWRCVDGRVEATAFHPLPDEVWEGFAGEARALLKVFADRDSDVYRRYHHWWKKLPAGDTKVLTA